jgi:hypothetical protein
VSRLWRIVFPVRIALSLLRHAPLNLRLWVRFSPTPGVEVQAIETTVRFTFLELLLFVDAGHFIELQFFSGLKSFLGAAFLGVHHRTTFFASGCHLKCIDGADVTFTNGCPFEPPQ